MSRKIKWFFFWQMANLWLWVYTSSTRAYEFSQNNCQSWNGGSGSNFFVCHSHLLFFCFSCIDDGKSSVIKLRTTENKKISVIFNDETLPSATTTTKKNCDYNNFVAFTVFTVLDFNWKNLSTFLSLILTKKKDFCFFCIGRDKKYSCK